MMRRSLPVLLGLVAAACAGASPPARPAPQGPTPTRSPASQPAEATRVERKEPVVPPALAFMAGLMPLRSTGVDAFRAAHPTYDGRGVLVGILDSGIDAGTYGLITTSAGAPKILDLRDFSGEGRVALAPVTPVDGTVTVGGRALKGAGRIARLAAGGAWYAGVFRELPLGKLPAADVNGNGTNTDVFPVVVARASDGWVAFIDSNLDGSFEDEMPLHDYREGRETIALGTRPLTIAANFSGSDAAPVLDLIFDTSGHGTHVAGIAAGHNLFNLTGFDGVAPGAQVLGLKIANNARGGISVHGSMLRAMEYATRFAAQRNMPLVLSLSFGIGNEHEGRAVIDSLVDAFLEAHPAVVLAVSAGNDGPGLSTLGFPGSADLALSVGALYPGPFAKLPQPGEPRAPDVMAWFSARGGELDKPDVVAPGVAYSAVPPWETGSEVKGGTSMSAPHAAGLVACLISALAQENRRVSAAELMDALRVAARRVPRAGGAGPLDQGAGVPQLEAAYRWLEAGHQGSTYVVRASTGASAAYRRNGLAGPGDTLEVFRVRSVSGLRAAQFRLRADVPWLSVPAVVTADPRATEIPVVYRAAALSAPGLYVGSVTARNPSDSLGAPLFTLVSTVIVPHDLAASPLADERQTIFPGGVQRYFVATPAGGTLQIAVTLADSQQRAAMRLYEPSGQPSRAAEEIGIGKDDGGTARLTVRAEDVVPGVYELDVIAIPPDTVSASVRAELGPLMLGAAPDGGVEASTVGAATVGARVSHLVVGAERAFEVAGRGAPPESLVVRVPRWATRAEVDVRTALEQWDEFTDFALTAFDSVGQIVSGTPFDYANSRHGFDVRPELQGRPLTIELFPAYARPVENAHPWRASVRIRFLMARPRPASGAGDLSVVPGGRVLVPRPERPALELPAGFQPLIETHVQPAIGPESVYRGPTAVPPP